MRDSAWKPTLLIRASLALHGLALAGVIAAPAQWRWALGAVIIDHLLLAVVGLWPRSHWLGPNWTRLPAAAVARNEIALTLDDGPDPGVTPRVLDILDRYAVQATFFCVGEKAARYPDLCREIVRRGHAVENHTQHHRHDFSLQGPRGFMREVQAAQHTLHLITGQRPLFFRAPAGFDTRIGDPDQVRHALLRDLRAGAILLLHDGNAARSPHGVPVVLAVLPGVLESAAAAGLNFVSLRDAVS